MGTVTGVSKVGDGADIIYRGKGKKLCKYFIN